MITSRINMRYMQQLSKQGYCNINPTLHHLGGNVGEVTAPIPQSPMTSCEELHSPESVVKGTTPNTVGQKWLYLTSLAVSVSQGRA